MKKTLTLFLLVSFVFAFCVGAFADNTAVDPAQQNTTGAKPGSNNSAADLNSAVNSLSSYYSNYFLNALENKGATWLGNTTLNFAYGAQWDSFTYQFDTVQPLTGQDWLTKQSLPFVEASIFGNSNSDMTINLGLGYRKLNDAKNRLMGVNAFWDYGNYNNNFNPGTTTYHSSGNSLNHQRVGLGVEYMQSYFEGYANYYLPISAQQYLGQDQNRSGYQYYQEALSGYDVALTAAIPGAEWLKANVRGYQYFGNNTNNIVGSSNYLNGFDIGASAQVTPQLLISGGYDTGAQNGYMKASFNLLAMPVPALFLGDKTISNYAQYNLSNKLLNHVQRNNVIMVANERQAYNNGETVAVSIPVKDWNGNPVAGVSCTLVNSAGTYSITQLTNSSGYAVFNVPKSLWTAAATGAVSDGEGITSVWNFAAYFYKFTQAGSDPNVGSWSKELVTANLQINSSSGVVPSTVPSVVVTPQPTAAQIADGTRTSSQEPPTDKPTYCQVTVVDEDGAAVAIKDNFKVVLLDPSKASTSTSTNLPTAEIVSSDLSAGTIKFEAKLAASAGGDDTEDSGAYGVAVVPANDNPNNTAYGGTINLSAYQNTTTSLKITIKKNLPAYTVTVLVRDLNGNPVADGTYVRAGSTVNIINTSQYDPPAQRTVNGKVTFSDMTVGDNFYVLAYTQQIVSGQPQNRTVVAVGQFVGLNTQYSAGATIPLTVQQISQY